MGMNGCWEARNYSPDGVITLDTGPLETPLPMQLNAGSTICLQQSVEGWCSQTRAKYALCTATPILCLQLLRFSTSGEAVSKDVRPVKGLTGTIRIPVYTAFRIRLLLFNIILGRDRVLDAIARCCTGKSNLLLAASG